MTNKELIEALKKYPDNSQVYLKCLFDPEVDKDFIFKEASTVNCPFSVVIIS